MTRFRGAPCGLLVVVCLLPAAGCGGEGIETVPVSGVVTLNGEPLRDAGISFLPISEDLEAPASYATTDSEGRYALRLGTNDRRGAIPGRHRVMITAGDYDTHEEDDETIEYDEPIPVRYNAESTLIFTVPGDGTDEANFDLQNP